MSTDPRFVFLLIFISCDVSCWFVGLNGPTDVKGVKIGNPKKISQKKSEKFEKNSKKTKKIKFFEFYKTQ